MGESSSAASATSAPGAASASTEAPPLLTGPWRLEEYRHGRLGQPRHGMTVFSCFHCGGGSTMGYKLAGYEVLGGVEIDPQMMRLYRKNHRPLHSFLTGVQEFKATPRGDLPPALLDLDVLDGSPPCSSFSTAGKREKKWGVETHFREGQASQVLDDLFFHFIDVAALLRPRIVVAENVKGLIMGNARGYVREIFDRLDAEGYDAQLFLLNSARMGVPQARERTFFLARRRDLALPEIALSFNEPEIPVARAFLGASDEGAEPLRPTPARAWKATEIGRLFSYSGGELGKMTRKLHPARPASTQTATPNLTHWRKPRGLSPAEAVRVQSFPDDYDFLDADPRYVCGMSVPPFMMQRVATEIFRQWLSRL